MPRKMFCQVDHREEKSELQRALVINCDVSIGSISFVEVDELESCKITEFEIRFFIVIIIAFSFASNVY